ncbi:MAG: hypothetical protein R3A45_12945 [Bdellovibrionota bacterium]
MQIWKNIYLVLICMLFCHCSQSNTAKRTPLVKPIAIAISDETITTGSSNNMRLAYVLDEQARAIVVLDVVDDQIIDTQQGDQWDRTPIPAGGKPVAIAIDDQVSPHRVFVADAQDHVVWGFALADTAFVNKDSLQWDVLDLGATSHMSSSQPLFFNVGASSDASLQDLMLNQTAQGIESWIVRHSGDQRFKVTGTQSGEQISRARVGQTYETDNNELSFLVQAGSLKLSDADRFYFSTLQGNPLELPSKPIDMVIAGRTLAILTNDADSLIVFDLDTLTITTTKALTLTAPTRLSQADDKIYIVNAASNQVEVYDIENDTLTLMTLADQSAMRVIQAVQDGAYTYAIGATDNRLVRWNDAAGDTQGSLRFESQPNDVHIFENDGVMFALVSMQSGNVALVNLETFSVVDTDTGVDADFSGVEFYDTGAPSSPELVSVGTFDNRTLTEQWQLIYQVSIPGLNNVDVTIASDVVTFTAVDLSKTTYKLENILKSMMICMRLIKSIYHRAYTHCSFAISFRKSSCHCSDP